jgi:hypothetical protein
MADEPLDALVATFDIRRRRFPTCADARGCGCDGATAIAAWRPRRLPRGVPAGFTADGLPVGLEIMARVRQPTIFKLACMRAGTHHRKPPATTPAIRPPSSAR